VVAAIAVAGCARLPDPVERTRSTAFTNTADTRLGRTLAPMVAANPGKTGVYVLSGARDAYAARVLLARGAERGIDVQYYIWRADTTGRLLCDELWQAAQRGVRVRLLLDDANTKGLDEALAVLDAHPNIEVRLFNPFANRGFRLGDFVTDFSRVNRRMHNKSFIADNQLAIVGGRNVGDEYFGTDTIGEFADLDTLAAGAVVADVSREFDRYWNSASAYPVAGLVRAVDPARAEQLRAHWAKVSDSPDAVRYVEAVRDTPLLKQLLAGALPLEWASAHVVSDDPSKVLRDMSRGELNMLPRLQAALGDPARELDLISPYFVPTEDGVIALRTLVERGVKVRVLTNSLSATDVSPVHAGYSKYREGLLKAGVKLYEMKPVSQVKREHGVPGSSSGGQLHAKTFGVDRSRIFVGSFNIDPRSAWLNTEMGVVYESPALAGRLARLFDAPIPGSVYEVRLVSNGRGIEWIEQTAAGETRHGKEPETGVSRRMWISFLSWLPIEWLL